MTGGNQSVTAGGRNYLRGLSLTRLKKYVDAYNITTDGVLEKDDLIEKILAARVSVLLYVTLSLSLFP